MSKMHPDDRQLLLFKPDFSPDRWRQMTQFRKFTVAFIQEQGFKKGAEL